MLPSCRGDEGADATGGIRIKGMPLQSCAVVGMHLIGNSWCHPLAELTKSWGAKQGANAGRRQATQSDTQRRLIELAGTSGYDKRRPATVRLRLTSEGPQVRTLLRPPGQNSKDGASPAETRWGTVFCSPAGYGCSRLATAGCAQYVPKSVRPHRRRCYQRTLTGGHDRPPGASCALPN